MPRQIIPEFILAQQPHDLIAAQTVAKYGQIYSAFNSRGWTQDCADHRIPRRVAECLALAIVGW